MTVITHPTAAASRGPAARFARHHPLTSYFALAFALTWALVLPMTLSRNYGVGWLAFDLPEPMALLLFLLASFVGPTVAALIVAGLGEGRVGMAAVLRPIARWRVGAHWYAVALFANMAIWLAAYGLVVGPALLSAVLAGWPLLLSTFLPAVAFGLLIPSLGEEPGWRGFALPRLQARYGPLRGTLILGALHGLWHLPTLGTIMIGPLRPAEIPPFLLIAIGATVLYTWLWNRSGGSLLLIMLLHGAGNATSQYLTTLLDQAGFALPETGLAGWLIGDGWLGVLAFGAMALLLIALTRGRLGASGDSSERKVS